MASTSGPTPLRRFLSLLKPDRKDIGYVYIYSVLIGILALVGPLGVQAIINLIAGGDFNASLVILVAVVAGASVLVGALKVMQYVVAETLQRRLFSRASFEFAYRLPRIKLAELRDHYPPELVNRFFDVLTVQKGLPKILLDLSGAAMQIIFGLVLLSLYHPFFAAFGGVRRTNDLLGGYLDARASHFKVLLSHYVFLIAFQALVTAFFLLLGGKLVIDNQINIGQFVAAEIVILLILSSAEKLIFTLDVVYDTLTGVEKIAAVTDLEIEDDGTLEFASVDTGQGMSVTANDLNFVYSESGMVALNNINFKLKPNERVCIAGYNRSGRSTLIQLLAGSRKDYSGILAFNETPMANLKLEGLRQAIGDYTVEESIVPGTLIDNICLGHPGVNFADVQWALGVAQLSDWVTEQPGGYDTELVAEGLNVPGSIRVRLLVARAIVRRPRLVVLGNLLDRLEPTTRKKIVAELANKRQQWTLVILSNEPGVARSCDRVLMMRRGSILFDGTPEETLAYAPTQEIWTTNGSSQI